MRNLWKSIILAAGVIALGGAAMAADVVRPPPIVAKPIIVAPRLYNWSGPYIGIQGGWDTNNLSTGLGGGQTATASGGIFGVFGGVNIALSGNLVFGVDGSINWDNARATTTSAGVPISAGPTWKGFIRGRLGLAADRLLFYGTFGGAVMHFEETTFPLGSNTPWGWTAGLGLDWGLTDKLFLRIDWAYSQYATSTLQGGTPAGVTYANKSNTVTVGLGFKF
jgi:outer membrane immunogenic protein